VQHRITGAVAALLLAAGCHQSSGGAAIAATRVVSGSVSASGPSARTHSISLPGPSRIVATLDWTRPAADLNLFLRDPATVQVARAETTRKPERITFSTTTGGRWSLAVRAKSGSSPYTLTVETTTLPADAGAPTYLRTIGGPRHSETYPSGLDVDTDGVLYVADTGNDAVVAYSPNGTRLWTRAKRGQRKDLGAFDNPRDVAVLGDRLYVVDSGYQRIQVLRKSDGVPLQVWTAALGAPIGISAGTDGADNRILLVSESTGHRVSVFTPDQLPVRRIGTGPGSAAGQLNGPRDAATDATGRTYVADYLNNRIVVFDPTGRWVETWGSTGTAPGRFVRPYGVDVDDSGRVYVADSNNFRIQVLSPSGDWQRSIGVRGSGPGQFQHLRRVAVGSGAAPLVYAADLWQWKVEVFSATGRRLRAIGNGAPTVGGFNQNSGLAVSDDHVYVTDSVNQRIQRFSRTAPERLQSVFGHRGWGVADLGGFNWPRGVAIDAVNNSIWIADTKNSRILEATRDGVPTGRAFGSHGREVGKLNWPIGVQASGGHVFVADTSNNRVQRWDPATREVVWTATGIGFPWDLHVVGNRVYVTDVTGRRVVRLDAATGALVDAIGSAATLHYPTGVAVSANGHVWVADKTWNEIVEFGPNGAFVQRFGGLGTAHGKFNTPARLAVHGNQLYVSDVYNDRVEVFSIRGS
jgi:tripartite motif-containing protein 71